MASISARMALKSTTELLGSPRSRRIPSRLSASARMSSSNNCDGAAPARGDRVRAVFSAVLTGVQSALIALSEGGRGQIRGGGGSGVRRRRSSSAARPRGFELVAAHGDLRHRGLEIEGRRSDPLRAVEGSGRRASRRSERRRSNLPGSIRAAALRRSARGGHCPAPRCPALEFGRQFQRRERPGLRRAKASFQSARSRNQRGPEFRARWRPAPARFVARSFPGVPRPHQALKRIVFRSVVSARLQSGVVGDRFVKPIVKAHAGAAGGLRGGVAGLPAHARDIPRHGSIHVLDHRSEAANRQMNGGDVTPQFCRGSW